MEVIKKYIYAIQRRLPAQNKDDIAKEIKRLKGEGFIVLNDPPKKGADNKLVAFLHPKSSNGVLVELCQEMK